uniref:Uncharacterized protein n=1 Tax=Kalanchoe fedtschenkoi TaxID=63787 RepID=A0A7N0V2G7_KALFE
MDFSPLKINLISCDSLSHISDIKLIRTDTTLDLSQNAEKGMVVNVKEMVSYRTLSKNSVDKFSDGLLSDA